MNAQAASPRRRRLAYWAGLVVAVALALAMASPARAAPPMPDPAAATLRQPYAGWQSAFGSRSRIIQIATVTLIVGIFILTRGRWR
jgi:hypothetical protein